MGIYVFLFIYIIYIHIFVYLFISARILCVYQYEDIWEGQRLWVAVITIPTSSIKL